MLKYRIDDPENEYHGQIGTLIHETKFGTPPLSVFHVAMPGGQAVTFLSHQLMLHKERKVLFLDIDGVCNSVRYMKSGAHRKGSLVGIDPYPAFMVGKIQLDTGCDVVLSSTWRLNEKSREEVRAKVVDFIDVTPDMWKGPRGAEIQDWLDRNPDVTRYAILDDDSDMLDSQKPNFFKTTWEEGLTEDIAKAVTEHLNAIAS